MAIRTKFKQTEIGEAPEEWRAVSLGEITTELIGGGTPKTDMPDYWDGPIEWMTSAFMLAREVYTGQRTITEKGLEASATHLVPKNNLLVATRVGIGKLAINRIDIAISQDITGVVLKNSVADTDFVYWAILSSKNKLKSMAQGSTIKGVLRTDLAKLSLLLPPPTEQRKIAEVLTTVDEAIQKVDETIVKTERVKQGLMDNLLTRGIGHKKFKQTEIGGVPEEWEIRTFASLVKEVKNGFASGERDENGIIQIRMNNLSTDGRLNFDKTLKVPIPHNLESYLLRDNDILFNNTNSVDLVGKSTIFKDPGFSCVFSNHFTRIRLDEKAALPGLFVYHFVALWRKNYFKSVAIRHVGQAAVNPSYVMNLQFAIPPIKEQQKLVDILGAFDQKLLLQRKRKERLERIKRGLMNELLTGKKKVKVS